MADAVRIPAPHRSRAATANRRLAVGAQDKAPDALADVVEAGYFNGPTPMKDHALREQTAFEEVLKPTERAIERQRRCL